VRKLLYHVEKKKKYSME